MDTKKDNDMIEHNKDQTEKQKARRSHLGNTGQIIEAIMVQNDLSLSYTKILKPIKLATGCDTFSTLARVRPSGKHCSLDMEALVGDPMNTETDQEVTILLNQYGLNDLRGPNRLVLERLSTGRTTLKRQLIENEDYRAKVPHVCFTRYHQAQVVPVVR